LNEYEEGCGSLDILIDDISEVQNKGFLKIQITYTGCGIEENSL